MHVNILQYQEALARHGRRRELNRHPPPDT